MAHLFLLHPAQINITLLTPEPNEKRMSMNQPLSLNRIAVIISILLISTSSHAQSNYAVSLDGTNDYVSTSAYVVPTSGNFTAELWVYATTYTGYQEFVSQGSA